MKYNLKRNLLLFIALFAFMFGNADESPELFTKLCAPCHSIGKGKLLGPDLKNISEKRSQEWLIAFIQSSQTLIKSGDADAIASFEEYNKLIMPDQPLDSRQVKAMLQYIDKMSSGAAGADNQEPVAEYLANATEEHVSDGLLLFSGEKRLSNGGASCISCHDVKDDRVFSNGTFAKELTETYGMIGGNGVAAILENPPYPTMSTTYYNHPLSEEEIFALTAYLKSVNANSINQQTVDFGFILTLIGVIIFILILTIMIALFAKRKIKSVNFEIHNRQSTITN
jgi:mono/diheme cytochrome c family protein